MINIVFHLHLEIWSLWPTTDQPKFITDIILSWSTVDSEPCGRLFDSAEKSEDRFRFWEPFTSATWSKSSGAHLWSTLQYHQTLPSWSTTHPGILGHIFRFFRSSEVGHLPFFLVFQFCPTDFISAVQNCGFWSVLSETSSSSSEIWLPFHPLSLICLEIIWWGPRATFSPEIKDVFFPVVFFAAVFFHLLLLFAGIKDVLLSCCSPLAQLNS